MLLSRDDNNRNIKAMKQKIDISKYCFVNRTTKLWNQLPAEALATFGDKKVQKCREVKNGE